MGEGDAGKFAKCGGVECKRLWLCDESAPPPRRASNACRSHCTAHDATLDRVCVAMYCAYSNNAGLEVFQFAVGTNRDDSHLCHVHHDGTANVEMLHHHA